MVALVKFIYTLFSNYLARLDKLHSYDFVLPHQTGFGLVSDVKLNEVRFYQLTCLRMKQNTHLMHKLLLSSLAIIISYYFSFHIEKVFASAR